MSNGYLGMFSLVWCVRGVLNLSVLKKKLVRTEVLYKYAHCNMVLNAQPFLHVFSGLNAALVCGEHWCDVMSSSYFRVPLYAPQVSFSLLWQGLPKQTSEKTILGYYLINSLT